MNFKKDKILKFCRIKNRYVLGIVSGEVLHRAGPID